MPDHPSLIREGFRRVWHYQRVLWFIFCIGLVLGHFGASPVVHKLDRLDHSLYAHRLADVFDMGAFSSLSSDPEVNLFEAGGTSVALSLIFLVGMVFLTGGILEAYRSGRKLTTREFFEACGSYFWRWVRLIALMCIVLIPGMILLSLVWGQATSRMSNAAQEKAGFWILVVGATVLGILFMFVRLWFDMAQVRVVVEEEYGMIANAGRAFRLTIGNLGSLFWMYFRLALLGWAVLAGGLYVWAKMPPARFFSTWLILEFVILFGYGIRLWQRACEMIWYQRRYLASLSASAPAPVAPSSTPLVMIAPPAGGLPS